MRVSASAYAVMGESLLNIVLNRSFFCSTLPFLRENVKSLGRNPLFCVRKNLSSLLRQSSGFESIVFAARW